MYELSVNSVCSERSSTDHGNYACKRPHHQSRSSVSCQWLQFAGDDDDVVLEKVAIAALSSPFFLKVENAGPLTEYLHSAHMLKLLRSPASPTQSAFLVAHKDLCSGDSSSRPQLFNDFAKSRISCTQTISPRLLPSPES